MINLKFTVKTKIISIKTHGRHKKKNEEKGIKQKAIK